ncbi:MAG: corrinoid protein [Clostridiales Family XIII bacterium]|jgi:corrinoid protein of di/trimethylamine methyltransferase|nr:corrinoid protein [Clostridiales Family XIII bacterium]
MEKIMDADQLYRELAEAVVEMDEELVRELAQKSLESGFDAFETIDRGLSQGMAEAGRLFEEEEYFVPELVMCSDALNVGIDILKPHLKTDSAARKSRAVIGVIEGDTHDIGKNLVRIMLDAAGFEMIDLGRDVPPSVFVEAAVKNEAELILLSSLMTTTMDGMKEVIDLLNAGGIREQIKVVVGGGPVSQAFADRIGADGYSRNAAEAVRLCDRLTGG